MKLKSERLFVLGFVGTLLLISLSFLMVPPQRFSELENRYLQDAPELTWDNVLSKKYAEEAEIFISDHFPFRNRWVGVKSTVEQSRLQKENNGIYKGKDGYLFEKFVKPNFNQILQNTESINQFASHHPDVRMTFMLAPTSVGLYPERLPWLAPSYPQKRVNRFISDHIENGVSFIDGFNFLSGHVTEPIYYRTDHHWTTYGAYLAYRAYAESKGWHPYQQKDYQIQTVSHSFLGSYHTKSQYSSVSPDSIQVYMPRKCVLTKMYIADTNETLAGMYDPRYLNKKDQYSYFLGGVHALMKLTTQLDSDHIEQEKLLVIKDSYAHTVIPFLTSHVPEIHVIDIRYYNGSISEYISKNGIKDVLFLFNTSTFVKDGNSLLGKLGSASS